MNFIWKKTYFVEKKILLSKRRCIQSYKYSGIISEIKYCMTCAVILICKRIVQNVLFVVWKYFK